MFRPIQSSNQQKGKKNNFSIILTIMLTISSTYNHFVACYHTFVNMNNLLTYGYVQLINPCLSLFNKI